MNKKAIWSLIVVVIVIILISVLVQSNKKQVTQNDDKRVPPTEPIKIGVMAMLTGDAAAWGNNAKKGIDLAVEEFRTAHPEKPIELVYVDTKGDSKEAVTGFSKLVQIDKVQFVIGPLFLNELTSIDPLVGQYGIPVISPAYTARENRKDPKNPLLMWMDAMMETDRIAKYVVGQGIKTVSIIHSTDAWETAVANRFAEKMKEAGVKVLVLEKVQQETNDVRLSVTKLIANKPHAVFASTYFQYINTLKALGEQKYQGKIFSIEIDDYLAGETKNFVPEVLAINPENYTSDFKSRFEKKYNVLPGMPAGHAYDAATLLLTDIAQNSDPKSVLRDFKTRTSFDGASGKIEFTANGETIFPTALYSIKDGVITRISQLK